MASEGLHENWERIFASICAAIIAAAFVGGPILNLLISALRGTMLVYPNFSEIIVLCVFYGAFSLIFILPCIALLGMPAAISIMAYRLERITGAFLLFCIATFAAFAAPLMLGLLVQDYVRPSAGFFIAALPFAYSAALAMWLMLYRNRDVRDALVLEEPVS